MSETTTETQVLGLQARFPASPAAVFRALTDPAELRSWLAEEADVDLDEGRFAFWGRSVPQGEPGRHRLTAAEPDRLLAFTWTLDGVETAVRIELAPDADRTALALRQDPLPTLDELMAPPGRRDGRHSMHTFWGLALPNLAEHLAGRAHAPRADFGPGRSREIRAELDIAAPAERVFASLVDPDQVARWFGWRPEIDPRRGGRISFGLDGEITEFEPGERLVYGDGEGAVVRWELAGSAGGTHLTFVQSGFGAGELDSAAQHEAGWLGGLAELRRMHELGAGWAPVTTDLPTGETPDGGRPS
jgi:uncharacterized protein YndB with AHSA1/START domain